MRSEDIKNRKWTKTERDAVKRIAAAQAGGDESAIDYADIPRLTKEQLAGMVRLRESFKEMSKRTMARARKLDQGVKIEPEVRIMFERPEDAARKRRKAKN